MLSLPGLKGRGEGNSEKITPEARYGQAVWQKNLRNIGNHVINGDPRPFFENLVRASRESVPNEG